MPGTRPGTLQYRLALRPLAQRPSDEKGGLVSRPRLFAALARGEQGRVALLPAPPRSGKTVRAVPWPLFAVLSRLIPEGARAGAWCWCLWPGA